MFEKINRAIMSIVGRRRSRDKTLPPLPPIDAPHGSFRQANILDYLGMGFFAVLLGGCMGGWIALKFFAFALFYSHFVIAVTVIGAIVGAVIGFVLYVRHVRRIGKGG